MESSILHCVPWIGPMVVTIAPLYRKNKKKHVGAVDAGFVRDELTTQMP